MARIFVVANQKGGVGKTTTTVNLAAALARLGKRTLLVDLDPQGNATMGSGIDKRALQRTVYHVLIGMCDVAEASRASTSGGYSVLPANRELAGAELELVQLGASLRAALAWLRAAKGRALLHGRDYVLPDDVKALAPPVIAHRLMLIPEAEMEAVSPVSVVQEALGQVAVRPSEQRR